MKGALLLSLLLSKTVAYTQERLVTVNGHQFHVYSQGVENRKPGQPVLIFENGLGMGLGNWNTVLDELAKLAPVFAYDRAGVEKSEKVYQMPTLQVVAYNLKSILKTLDIAPPYILIGHSMGGLYSRGFAGLYPREIAGLVFLDPADFTETKADWNAIFRHLDVPHKRIEELLYERLYRPVAMDSVRFGSWSEGQVLRELRKTDFVQVSQLPLPQVPIYFLVGGKFEVPPDRRSQDYDHVKFFDVRTNVNIERWKNLINSSSKGGMLWYLAKSGHYLHRDDPKAVISAVKLMLECLGN